MQRCKSERSSCAKVQRWRDGVAGDKGARGPGVQVRGLVDQRLGGSEGDQVDQLIGWPVGRRETPLVDTLTSGPVDMGDRGLTQGGTGDRRIGRSIS